MSMPVIDWIHGKIPLRQDCLAHAAAETEPLQAALKRPGAEQSQAGWNIFLPLVNKHGY